MSAKLQEEPKTKNPIVSLEEEVLVFWDRAKIFEQSVEREAPQGDYIFYDGPPFATGLPHYGHIVGSIMKDVVPRFWTMRGFRVERKWGWDCHGLPIENIAEKELGFKRKKDIIEYGVDKFNEFCRSKVLSYVEEWKVIIRRLGRWADMEKDYKTMDLSFMESVWWVFKQLWDKGLIYESYRSIHICPRCETTLSQQEVTEGYKDGIKDLSATVKFELVDELTSPQPSPDKGEGVKTFILAWTTTPWTLIGNTALAVGEKIDYVELQVEKESIKEKYIFARERLEYITEGLGNKINEDLLRELAQGNELTSADGIIYKFRGMWKGGNLVGKKYKPLFDYYSKDENLKNKENGWKIYAGGFVSTEDGTGIVHIAPAFGEDDLNLGKENNLPFVQHLGMDGVIHDEVADFKGLHVKPIEDVQATDKKIVEYLKENNKLFSAEQYEHNYPHCWRCETPLLNYVTTSWFVNVLKIKDRALELAKEINWSPAHVKEGRWGKWLEGARDWSISRQRFWASVMPMWKCEQCGELKVFGSVKELEEASGKTITDLHKHIVDEITFPCEKCGPSASSGQAGVMKRVSDVLDTWFDSGSMPYAQMHYPFENKEKFEANFPAKFIAEGSDQTRAWFYYLHVLATATRDKPAFKNVIVNGIVLAEDGKKMAKRLHNYTDPAVNLEKYGADAMRYYLLSSSVMMIEDLNFSDQGVVEALRKNLMVLWNVYKFYEMYAGTSPQPSPYKGEGEAANVLDRWIIARLNQLVAEVTAQMEGYDLPRSVRPISDFINDLSTWYIRRSRDRFKSENEQDKQAALATTQYVLIELSKVMAPFMPFIAEQIWQKVSGNNFQDDNKSVHLEAWSESVISDKQSTNNITLIRQMEEVRKIVEAGLAARDIAGMKIRQALSKLKVKSAKLKVGEEFIELIKDELNIRVVEFIEAKEELTVELDTELTEELKMDGVRRELVRSINNLRKNLGLSIADRVAISWSIDEAEFTAPLAKQVFEKFGEEIKKDTLADSLENGRGQGVLESKEVKVNGETVWLGLKKI
jgi:isoleucyl-tRNA synthetase